MSKQTQYKITSKRTGNQGNPQFQGYINIHLTADDEKALKELNESAQDLINWFGQMLFEGYKLSIKVDDEMGTFKGSLMCVNRNLDHAGYLLSSWGSSLEQMLTVLKYKHTVKCPDGEWSVWLTENREFG